MTNTLRVAAVQTTLYPKDEGRAVKEAERLAIRAAAAEARLICLPEHWLLSKVVEPENDIYERFAKLAVETGTYINLGGIYEKGRGATHFVSPTIGPKGRVLSRQKKVHLYRGEKKRARPGDAFETFRVEGTSVGTLVCHDVVFPESARTLALLGAELLLVPSLIIAAGITPWHVYLKARSLENRVPLVSPNIYFPPRVSGKSQIVDLHYDRRNSVMGLRTKTAPDGRSVITADVELGSKKAMREERLAERRPTAYRT